MYVALLASGNLEIIQYFFFCSSFPLHSVVACKRNNPSETHQLVAAYTKLNVCDNSPVGYSVVNECFDISLSFYMYVSYTISLKLLNKVIQNSNN